MKIPKRNNAPAKILAPEHPLYMAEGGEVPEKKAASYPKGFDPAKLKHYLAKGEQPLTPVQLAEMGYLPGNAENEYILPEEMGGGYSVYDTVSPEMTGYNNAENPYYVPPTQESPLATRKPKYPKVGTPEWTENQDAVKALRDANYGIAGMKKGGGIKGYVTGGDIREDEGITGKGKREYANRKGLGGVADYANDIMMGAIDTSLGAIDPDIIKDSSYKTKAGSKYNNAMHGVNEIGSAVNNQVVNYFVPGMGTAIGHVKSAYGKEIGEDEGLNQRDKEKQGKVATGINTFGPGIASMLKGKMGNKKAEEEAPAENVSPVTATPEGTTVTPIVQQSQSTQGSAAVDYSTYDTSEFNSAQASVWGDLKTNSERENFLRNQGLLRMNKGGGIKGYVKGGKIIGPGTGKSDSIPAKVEDGGFIVPAENAHLAEQLRAEYFGNAGKKAPLKSGNTKVKLSNGEHYFTAEEKAHLLAQGINLDALAPEADHTATGKKKGGEVDEEAIGEDTPKRKESTGNAQADKIIDEAYSNKNITAKALKEQLEKAKALAGVRGLKGTVPKTWPAPLNDFHTYVKKKEQSEVNSYKKGEETKKNEKVTSSHITLLKKSGANDTEIEEYKKFSAKGDAIKHFNRTNERVKERVEKETTKTNADKAIETAEAKNTKAYNEYQKVTKNPENYTADQIKEVQDKFSKAKDVRDMLLSEHKKGNYKRVSELAGSRLNNDDSDEVKATTYEKDDNKKASSSASSGKRSELADAIYPENYKDSKSEKPKTGSSNNNPLDGRRTADSGKGIKKAIPSPYGLDPEGKPLTKETLSQQETLPKKETPALGTDPVKDLKTPSADTTSTSPLAGRKEEKKKTFGSGTINPETAIALTQAGLGMQQLLADGKRPEDALDPDFVKSVKDAQLEANFGISPLEREIANRGIERNRRAGIKSIIGLSSGSAGTALGNITANNIAANDSISDLSLGSEKLRLQKRVYADSLVAKKADMKRQLFQDKLEAFNVDQEAGANLLGSGVSNYIGSMRYDKQLAANAEADRLSKPTFII